MAARDTRRRLCICAGGNLDSPSGAGQEPSTRCVLVQDVFGRNPRTQLDDLIPTLVRFWARAGEHSGLEASHVPQTTASARFETREVKIPNERERVNAGIARVSPGARAETGNKVLMKEAASPSCMVTVFIPNLHMTTPRTPRRL